MPRLTPVVALVGWAAFGTVALQASGLTFFTSGASFDAAAPGLPLEDFSGLGVAIPRSSPLFAPTSGLEITTLNPGMVSTALQIDGTASSAKAVGTYWFQDTLILEFAPDVSAVGEDVFGNTNPGPAVAGSVQEDVYDGTTLLGSKSISEAAGVGGYIGVTSTTANITSIRLLFSPTADVDSNTLVTDVAFGSTTPEPGSLALLSAAAALAVVRRLTRNAA
jgi:hypothetical protein